MTELTQAARLALAVRANVATIRLKEAEERATLLRRRAAPIPEACKHFQAVYGTDPDISDRIERTALGELSKAAGDAAVTWDAVAAAPSPIAPKEESVRTEA